MPRDIAFRQLEQDDLPLLYDWLARPHVHKWYSQAPSSFAEVQAKYGPRTEEDSLVKAFVIQVDLVDAGYIQAYAIEEFPDYAAAVGAERGAIGVDLFIGEESFLRRGIGPAVIRHFVDGIVFGHYGAAICIAGPNDGNEASIRAFEKAGFQRWKTIENEHGERECMMRLERDAKPYRLETIDLDLDAEMCAAFRRDMLVASFGSDEGFEAEMGPGNALYLDQLRARIAAIPEGNAHLWHADQIVGQAEMRLVETEPHVGYVSLFYVIPEFRGRGLGRMLHDHAVEVFRRRGKRLMRLSVSARNAPAIAFYRKLGWVAVGTRPNKEPMEILEFDLR